jgi:DNA-binding GntR family transcriptional regulator
MPDPAPRVDDRERPLLAPVVALSRAAVVADRLVEAIAAGELAPGQRLVEVEVAGRLAVSRVPLREAMKSLEAQGILVAEAHRGTRVAPFDEGWARSVRRARIALERLAFRDAAPRFRAEPERFAALDRLVQTMERRAAHDDWLSVIKADLGFHRTVVRAAGDGILATLWETLARHVLIVFGRETRPNWAVLRHGEKHRELMQALGAGEPDELDREVERHILRVPRLLAATAKVRGRESGR